MMNETMTLDPRKQGRPQYNEAVIEQPRFYTCSQSAIPETVAELINMIDRNHYTRPMRHETEKEARAKLSQTGQHNVLLEDQGDGMLKIALALWDSK